MNLTGKLCLTQMGRSLIRLSLQRNNGVTSYLGGEIRNWSTAAVPKTEAGETPIKVSTPVGQEKIYEPKLRKIVDEISKLTLLEVSELNELLKKTLNIPDAPMMSAAALASFGAPAPAAAEEEETQPKKIKTNYTVKLLKFDDTKKVALIKEVKSLLEGMNLVQAKKFVESAPTIVKADIAKDEAEKLKAAFEAVGGSCEIV